MGDGSAPLTTVVRAFEVLELLWELDGAGPTAVAQRLDVPNSTAYDYLRSLAETKYVDAQDGEYVLSPRFYTIAGKMKYRNRLFQIAKPEMQRFAAETGELVGLTVEMDGQALILHQEEGGQALRLGTYPGAVIPMHTHAAGKAILANLPPERVAEIVEDGDLVGMTEHTVTDPEALEDELARIREDGYVVDWDQQVVGMGMAAVPMLVEDRVFSSIGVVAPTERLKNEQYQDQLLQKLQELANTITVNYRYGN